jgi:hypothetical protein
MRKARAWSFLFVGVLFTILGVALLEQGTIGGLPLFLHGLVAGLNYAFAIAEWRDA